MIFVRFSREPDATSLLSVLTAVLPDQELPELPEEPPEEDPWDPPDVLSPNRPPKLPPELSLALP
jgi:hypothetical protein